MKTLSILLSLALAIGAYMLFYKLPIDADRRMNAVVVHAPYKISSEGAALHDTLMVADLHADTLLWMRNPLHHHERGHVDLPRLQAGGVALQVFSAVTKTPKNLNYEHNTGGSDDITLLAIAQRWPLKTWTSIYERAAYMAHRLSQIAENSDGQLRIIRTQSDLQSLITDRNENAALVGGILAIEGSHPLEGDLNNVQRLFAEGYRVMGLQHFFDNALGGSLHGVSNAGLTPFGIEAVAEMERLHIIIDVAHSSPAVVRDVLGQTKRPIIVSHTGLAGVCAVKRNISDALMAQIASRGGLIGIGYWEDVTCDASPEGIARVIVYGIEKFGVEAIALGSDFDGTVTTELDSSELAAITDALLDQGVSEEDIRLVMGGNALRFFAENLPQ